MSAPRRVRHVPRHIRYTDEPLHLSRTRPADQRPTGSTILVVRPDDEGGVGDTTNAPRSSSDVDLAAPATPPAPAPQAPPETDPPAHAGETKASSTRGGLLRSTALMASGSLVSRLLGFVRSFLFGAIFVGVGSAVGSAYSAANVMPNTIWLMVGGGTLNAILVPAIVRAAKHRDRGSDFISRLSTLVALAAGALTLVSMAAVPLLLVLTSGNLPPATYALAVMLGYWLMPQIFFDALYVMCGQLLNAHDSFGPYQWAPVFNNLVAIVGSGIFLLVWGGQGDPDAWTLPMVIALAAINVGGSATQVLFLSFYVRKLGLKLRPKFGFRGLGLGKFGRIGLWTLAALGLGQLGIWAGRWAVGKAVDAAERLRDQPEVAAQFPGLLTMEYAYMVFMIPQGILAVSLVTAAFPAISRSAADGDHDQALQRYTRTNRLLAVPMMLCTALFMALAGPVMWVIDGGTGVIGAQANGLVLAAYMIGLVPFAATYLTKRAFYAYEDARTPFLMQIPVTLIPLLAVAPIWFGVDPRWAAPAAALAASLGNLLGWAYGQWLLARHAARLGTHVGSARGTVSLMGRLLVAGALSLVVGLLLVRISGDLLWTGRLLTVGVGVAIGLVMSAVFVAVAWVLRVEELRSTLSLVWKKVGRRTRPDRGSMRSM